MRASILAVGSELLHAGRRDSNGDWLAERLQRRGVDVAFRALLPDEPDLLADSIRLALSRSDLVMLSGGLGPTEDDRTREAAARALGVPLVRDEEVVGAIRARFEERGRPFRPHQARQADRPDGADWLANPLGTAPGFLARAGRSVLVALPGVPGELRTMFDANVDRIVPPGRAGGRARRTFKISGRLESSVDRQIRDLYDTPGCVVTILAGVRGIELHVVATGVDEAEARRRLEAVEAEIVARTAPDLYGRDDDTLAAVAGEALLARGWTVAVAESCTGGLLGGELTSVPGSSRWFRGGLLVYTDELKVALAGVDRRTIEEHGAVSEPVACELARGARSRCASDVGIGVTGIAGPGGGTDRKPVGLVHVAIVDPAGETCEAFRFPGDREAVRARTVAWALDRLWRRLGPAG